MSAFVPSQLVQFSVHCAFIEALFIEGGGLFEADHFGEYQVGTEAIVLQVIDAMYDTVAYLVLTTLSGQKGLVFESCLILPEQASISQSPCPGPTSKAELP